MANFKRGRPVARCSTGNRPKNMKSWPKWWDVLWHTRPRRREVAKLEHEVKAGVDPDGIAWPVSNHKPHKYYW